MSTISGKALYEKVVRYSIMGEHRTGTEADLKTSSWIRNELDAAGFETEYLPWTVRQFFIDACRIELYGQNIKAFPLWYPKTTGKESIRARLVVVQNHDDCPVLDGCIALFVFSEDMVTAESRHDEIISKLADAGAIGIIGCYPDESEEVYGQNSWAPFNETPWPIPVAMVAPRDWHILEHAADVSDKVGLLIDGRDEPKAEAKTVIGRLARSQRWIVVSTPQSGWFRCAGERGTGLAFFLELAKWASERPDGPSLLFISNPGHENGHIGMHHTLEKVELPAPDSVLCWLHLGASIATRKWVKEGPFLKSKGYEDKCWLLGSAELHPILQDSFHDLPHINPDIYRLKRGEIRWILEQGYPAFALMGPHRFFHLPSDGPEVTSPELLEPVGSALTRALSEIAKQH